MKADVLSLEQQEILNGLMLGDGHLSKVSKNAKLEIVRSIIDKDYILNHKNVFKEFLTDKALYESSYFDKRTNKNYERIRLRTKTSEIFTKYHDLWYENKIKIVPKNLILTPLTIATWLADDGSFYYHSKYKKTYFNSIRLQIATDGFVYDDVCFLKQLLDNRYNCNFSIYNKKQNHYLMITKKVDVLKIIKDIDYCFPLKRKSDIWNNYNFLEKNES